MSIKCVVFDMDDTLYPEIEYCKSGFRAAAHYIYDMKKKSDPESLYAALWKQFCHGDRTRVFNQALEDCGVDYDIEFVRSLVNYYRDHKPNIKLLAESRQVLDILKDNYPLALLTDGFLPAQRLKVESLGIEEYFKVIVYSEELGREFWKPSTVGFEKIVKEIGVTGQECVYIADNAKKDFIGPNKLGFTTVQLKLPQKVHLSEPQSDDARPDYVIESILELPELLYALK